MADSNDPFGDVEMEAGSQSTTATISNVANNVPILQPTPVSMQFNLAPLPQQQQQLQQLPTLQQQELQPLQPMQTLPLQRTQLGWQQNLQALSLSASTSQAAPGTQTLLGPQGQTSSINMMPAQVQMPITSPLNAMQMQTSLPSPQMPMTSPFGQQAPPKQLGSDGDVMEKAYLLSSALVRDRLAEDDLELLDSVKSADIVVVQGTYDHIHKVLEAIKIPFLHINHQQLATADLRPEQTVYVNCASSFPPACATKLAKFVQDGGQLITTDWALKNVLEVGFPGRVVYNGKSTGDEVVPIEILDRSDDVLTGMFDESTGDDGVMWWLEGSSYPIKILDTVGVKKLVASKELGRKYGEDAVIISFQHGKGVVYHMISHFYLQRSETRSKKHALAPETYAKSKGASATTVGMLQDLTTPDSLALPNFGQVQSASNSTEFVSRAAIKQKKKFAPK